MHLGFEVNWARAQLVNCLGLITLYGVDYVRGF